jgi:hypothetical protein
MYNIIKTRGKIFSRVTRMSTAFEIRQVFIHNKTTPRPARSTKNSPGKFIPLQRIAEGQYLLYLSKKSSVRKIRCFSPQDNHIK